MTEVLEGIAAELLERWQGEAVDAIDIAESWGLEVCYSDAGESILMGDTIFVPRKVRLSRLQWLVAHELGHWALRRAGEDDSDERSASYVGGAVLVPRRDLSRSLRQGWDLDELRRQHPYAPAHAIAVRVAQVREAGVAVYDQGRLRRRWGPTVEKERELADAALQSGLAARLDACTGGWPVFDGSYRRVIVLGPCCGSPDFGTVAG